MDKSTRDEENGFLLEVCVSGMGQASEASHPPPSLDWDYLIHFLDMHYLSGMARRHLIRGGAWDRIPPQAQARLTATYANVTASTLLSVQWLEQLARRIAYLGLGRPA